jgi:hypothetical protein
MRVYFLTNVEYTDFLNAFSTLFRWYQYSVDKDKVSFIWRTLYDMCLKVLAYLEYN